MNLNGKIIHSQIQTDRLGFMQQLGIIPNKITPANESNVIFIDKFYVPKNSVEEFKTKMNSNSSFIKLIAGYVKGEAFEQVDENGNLTIITIATWENQDCLDKAKSIVQAEFKKNNFNPSEFYTRLEVKLDRGLYKTLLE